MDLVILIVALAQLVAQLIVLQLVRGQFLTSDQATAEVCELERQTMDAMFRIARNPSGDLS